MATWPLGRFVDRPALDALVRYECNAADASAPRRMTSDFTLGAPTLDGDPDAVGVSWGFRSPSFTQRVKGPKRAALEALAGLSRELLRRTNWFEFKLDQQTPSVWLKVYRSSYSPLSLSRVYVDTRTGDETFFDEDESPDGGLYRPVPDTWEIEVPLIADPFLYGARETLGPVVITQSATGDHPMRWVLPPLKGDAPAPLRVSVDPDQPATFDVAQWLLACTSATAEITDPVLDVGIGDSFDTYLPHPGQAGDGYIGGSYRPFDLGTNPADPSVFLLAHDIPDLCPGRYRALMRVELDANLNTFDMYFRRTKNITATPGPTTTHHLPQNSGTHRVWINLGEVSTTGAGLPEDMQSFNSMLRLIIMGWASATPAAIRVDAVKLVPLDGVTFATTLLDVTNPASSQTAIGDYTDVYDGDTSTYWGIDPDGNIAFPSEKLSGGFLTADPHAAINVLTVMAINPGVLYGDNSSSITAVGATSTVSVSYHPRYLHLPGDA